MAQIQRQFSPYFLLWTISADFSVSRIAWMTGPFLELRPALIESELLEWRTCAAGLVEQFAELPAPLALSQQLLRDTTAFTEWLPLLWALASKALSPRHWGQLRDATGITVSFDEELQLQHLLDLGFMNHLPAVQAVGEVAEQESELENSLKAMTDEWHDISFVTAQAPFSGGLVVQPCDSILALFDDHIVQVERCCKTCTRFHAMTPPLSSHSPR